MSQGIHEKSAWRWHGPIGKLVGLVCALAACGDNFHEPRAIRVEPSDAVVSIVNGAAVAKTYTATFIDASGGERDATDRVTFSLRDARYGSVQDATVTVTGQGAGPTRVIATYGELTGDTGLTVFVKDTIVDPDLDPATPQWFDGAAEDASLAPTIRYPFEGSLVPPNLGQLDVHWRQSIANVFEVRLSNTYCDVKRYTNGEDPNQPYWTVFELAQWYPVASAHEPFAIDVAGMSTTDPTKKGPAPTLTVDVTNEDAQGAIYYFATSTTSTPAGIMSYDLSKNEPDVPPVSPAPYVTGAERPDGCMGCHTLSRDGTKIAMTFKDKDNFLFSRVFDVASRTQLTQLPLIWSFATFNAQATKLVTVEGDQLYLRALDGGKLLANPLPTVVMGAKATHPDFSPDNKRLVNVEFTQGGAVDAYDGSIVVRDYDAAADMFGEPTVLVPRSAGGTNAYPSFSPDGQWIAFTRTTTASSYNNSTAAIWVVKADNSQPPIPLTKANFGTGLTNSWARWAPAQQTSGPSNEPLVYLTFSSKREVGVRSPSPSQPQIWMTPFHPDRAEQGLDPSDAAVWLPFQDVNTGNHIAQWTQAVVGQ